MTTLQQLTETLTAKVEETRANAELDVATVTRRMIAALNGPGAFRANDLERLNRRLAEYEGTEDAATRLLKILPRIEDRKGIQSLALYLAAQLGHEAVSESEKIRLAAQRKVYAETLERILETD